MELKVVFSFVPICDTTEIIASEMPAAISPYSIAVAPDSSLKNCSSSFVTCRPHPTGSADGRLLSASRGTQRITESDGRPAIPVFAKHYYLVNRNFCVAIIHKYKCDFTTKRLQRENFLYLIRCGMTESVPSRRILSFSYS
jgi:hypothetical protein